MLADIQSPASSTIAAHALPAKAAAATASRFVDRADHASRTSEQIAGAALIEAIQRAEGMTAEVHALERAHAALDAAWVSTPKDEVTEDLTRRLEAANKAWLASRRRQEDVILTILDLPVKSAGMAAAKLDAFERLMGNGRGIETEEDMEAALDAARRDLQTLGGTVRTEQPGVGVIKQWQAALAEYQDAAKGRDEARAADHRGAASVNLQGPEQLQGRQMFYDYAPKWASEDDLRRDVLLTSAERAALLPAVLDWDKRRSEILRMKYEAGTPGALADERLGAAVDRYDDAVAELATAQPPSLSDLILQQRLIAGRLSERETDHDAGFEDLGWCCVQWDDRWVGRPMIQQFIHLVRLAGLDHRLLHIEWFSPLHWVEAFEGAGGKVSSGIRGLHVIPPAEETEGVTGLLKRLYAEPYHFWAVKLYADKRKAGGGDPIFDCWGEYGAHDNRGGKDRLYGVVSRCDLVEFVMNPNGGSPNPIITKIDRRQGQ